MSNTITIELCEKDRALLKNLTDALGLVANIEEAKLRVAVEEKKTVEADPVQQKLAETLAKATDPVEAPKNATEEAESVTPPATQAEEEEPTVEEPAEPTTEKTETTVTHAELMAKVIELSAKDLKLKAQVRDIVLSYAPRVKAVPEEKLNECYNKIVALEGSADA